MDRRRFLLTAFGAVALGWPAMAARPPLKVFKSPTCGCCSAWVTHMSSAGFDVRASDVDNGTLWDLKMRAGIPTDLTSCHTGFIEGYVVEGHVPAPDVHRLLAERPEALGLTVPGMPIGSPGMEMGDRRDAFDTLLLLRDGETRVFQRYG